MTDIYLHIVARMADYIRTHPYAQSNRGLDQPTWLLIYARTECVEINDVPKTNYDRRGWATVGIVGASAIHKRLAHTHPQG